MWTTHSLMSAKILDSDIVVVSLNGNAVSPGHVIRAGLQNGTMSAGISGFTEYLEDKLNTAGHLQSIMQFKDSDILYMVKTGGGVDAAKRLHLPPPSPPPPGTPFQTPKRVLPNHSDVAICTCTPRFILRMAMLAPGNRPLTGLLPHQSPPFYPLMTLLRSLFYPSQQAVMS